MGEKTIPAKLMTQGQIGIISYPSYHPHIGKSVIVKGNDLCVIGGIETDRWTNYKNLDESFEVTILDTIPKVKQPIEIKVKGCVNCPMAIFKMWEGKTICNHPANMYDGKKEGEFMEHCPLKKTETIIKFERENDGTRQSNTSDKS